MDLNRFLAVLRRFWGLLAAGAVVALLLTLVATAKVEIKNGAPSVAYRKSEQWASETRLLLTQPQFNAARLQEKGVDPATALNLQSSSDARLPGFASLYSNYVTSDAVQKVVLHRTRLKGALESSVVQVSPTNDSLLPIISIVGVADTPADSVKLAVSARQTLAAYVDRQQSEQGVPTTGRVQLTVLNAADLPKLIRPHSKTLPVAVFLVVLFAFVGLAFMLENLRPRVEVVPPSRMRALANPAPGVKAASEPIDQAAL